MMILRHSPGVCISYVFGSQWGLGRYNSANIIWVNILPHTTHVPNLREGTLESVVELKWNDPNALTSTGVTSRSLKFVEVANNSRAVVKLSTGLNTDIPSELLTSILRSNHTYIRYS